MGTETLLTRFGAACREARTRRGLAQAELAERAAVPRLKVIQVERGQASVAIGAYAALGLEFVPVGTRRPTLEEVGVLLDDG